MTGPADYAWADEPVSIDLDLTVEDVDDTIQAVDDYAPEPEFSDFEVWCDRLREWMASLRFAADGAWVCYGCGADDHPKRDHEGEGV